MAQSMLDALTGVSLDGPTVQSLLDSQTFLNEVEQSAIDQDEEDIFQCGKCKYQFTSIHLFVLHKREHLKETVDLCQYLVADDSPSIRMETDCQADPTFSAATPFVESTQLTEPIILQESDMLFSMDEEGANYLTSDTNFGVPIILSEDNLESFGSADLPNDSDIVSDVVDTSELNSATEAACHASELEDEALRASLDSLTETMEISTPLTDCSNSTSQTQNMKYKCGYCDKQFPKKFYWQQHERSHTGEKPYQCVVCGRAFAQKSNVKKHMSSHKVWPGTAIHSLPPEAPVDGSIDRTYHCQFCKEIFDSYKALKGHLIVSHLTLKVYKCVQSSCSMMFSDLDEFLEHTRSHKRSEYRCHVCGEIFNTLSDLGLHQYVHTMHKQKSSEKYYCCSVCKSSFSNLEALQHHTETTTHDYACPHCGKSFLIERFLRRHLKTHASSAKFACENCGKAFKTEQYLANHKLIHSDETPYTCPHCPARFKRKDRLGRHLLIHDKTKRLKCPFRGFLGCMSEFSRPDKLKRHMLTHSNIKRFSCSHCNRNFHRAQALKHHELNKHSLKCETCSHTFKTRDQLASHTCDEAADSKKHLSSQLPRKASGMFKSKKPTPKRQILSKNSTDKEKVDKSKPEEVERKQILDTMLPSLIESDNCMRKKDAFPTSMLRELDTTIESLVKSELADDNDKRNNDIFLIQLSVD